MLKQFPSNRILSYTMLAIILIAVYMAINSYYTQVSIYEEKELFKLDCIANAVAYKISGEEHQGLVYTYPSPVWRDSVRTDERYLRIREQMTMAKVMTKVPSSMQTIVRDTLDKKFYFAIGTDKETWLDEVTSYPGLRDSIYQKGGMIGRYVSGDQVMLGAMSPVRDAGGKVVGTLHVEETFDSFLKKAADQIYFNLILSVTFIVIIGTLMVLSVRNLLKRQNKLELQRAEVDNLRKELVANVSHDLRTPLAGIQGYLETLLIKNEDLDEPTRKQYLTTTLQNASKLKGLVDELFELSRLESRERKLNAEVFSLQELTFDVVNSQRPIAQEKNINLLTEFEKGIPSVRADVALIDRVLQNLISNAIKYCDRGDEVKIRLYVSQGKVVVEVADSGPGIPASELPHVFDRFHRVKSSKAGSGLGLAIVKSALELHGTQCIVESSEGQGATFRFSLTIA